jgi:hypothetical protein
MALSFTNLERPTGRPPDKRLVICMIPNAHASSFQSKITLAMFECAISPRNRHLVRLVLLRHGPPPSGPATASLYGYFLSEGGIHAEFGPEEGALILALGEVALRRPVDWEKWAVEAKPVTASGLLKTDIAWLMGASPPAARPPRPARAAVTPPRR